MSDKIERIIDALRKKILEEAIRGNLVPQNPEDEPASVLLQRIEAERERLIKEKKIKRPKSVSKIVRRDGHFYESINDGEPTCIDDDIPFEIPDSWEWVRGKTIFEMTKNMVPQKDFSYIDIDAIDNKRHIIKSGKPTKKEEAPSRARRILESGDVLFSLVRPYLENIALVENQYANAIASTGFYVVRSKVLFPGFAYILFLSPYVLQGLNSFMKGDNSPSIRSENIEDFLYPIPPLSEQLEIVKAFNELGYKLNALQKSRQRYKRILAETPTSLRQQLIQAAIQGQLVPQNPDDEPASLLLKRIAQERSAKLGKKAAKSMSRIERRGSKTYELFPDGSEKDISGDIPFEIPSSWEWCRIGAIFTLQAGKFISSASISEMSDKSPYPCYGGNGCRGYVGIFNRDGDYPLIGRQGALCGNINRATGKFYATEHAVCVESYYCVNVEWLCLFLRALNLNRYATATAQPGLAVSTLNEVLFPLPPQEEQNRIAKTIRLLSESVPL